MALHLFCEDIRIKNKAITQDKGPLLILANHPDSFLDAIIIGAIYNRKLHFLARADVFRNPLFEYLLRSIGMIPIFRAREGKEHLHKNVSTFEESVQILQNGGAVLIFIEGLCLNTNSLLPFKKGAARIVEQVQEAGVNLQIHVATLAYNDFHSIRKNVHIAFQKLRDIPPIKEAKDRVIFNEKVQNMMQKEVKENYTIPKKKAHWQWLFYPYYLVIKRFAEKKTNGTVFYDSVLFALLFFTFPLLLIGLFGIVFILCF